MAVTTTKTNKPINPRGNDQSPKGYNRAALYSGKALDFDGVNDSVTTSSNLDISNGSDLSYVSYFKTTETTAGYLFENNAFYVAIRRDDFNDGGTRIGKISSFISSSWLDTDLVVNDDHWHQCAMTLSNGTQKIYIDGQEIASATGKSYNTSGQAAPQIGARDTGFYFDGQIANTRVFNVGLTAAQVADLYNNPEKIVPTGVDNTALKLWLPMMEGAGTTAYDGSGNGNHGTISGATYVNGVGSPVAQSAVIDWNKGTNIIVYSQEFESPNWVQASGGTGASVSVTENYGISPSGYQDAYRIQISTGSGGYGQIYQSQGLILGATYTVSVYLKSLNGNVIVDLGWFNGAETNFPANVTEEWQRFTYTFTDTANVCYPKIAAGFTSSNNVDVLAYGYQIEQASSVGPYVRTGATAQTSDVLLPQGLTSGRDITGVNLFENVRKQGALNLDGNSWAEVHDNASLDVSALTCEGWMYAESITTSDNRIVSKWNSSYPERSFQLYGQNATINWMLSDGSAAYSITGGTLTQGQWHHLVGTYDGSTQKIYLDGVQVASTGLSITLKQSSFKVMLGGYTAGLYSLNPIAQPRIYNRALTAEEVLRNYNSGKSTYQ